MRVIRSIIPDGDAGTQATLTAMRQLVNAAQRDPHVVTVARFIVRDVDRAPSMHAQAVFEWVASHVRYVRDPSQYELVTAPRAMLDAIKANGFTQEDCDGFSVLLASLLESVGIETRFHVVGKVKNRPYEHVYVDAKIDGAWVPLDPSRQSPRYGDARPVGARDTNEDAMSGYSLGDDAHSAYGGGSDTDVLDGTGKRFMLNGSAEPVLNQTDPGTYRYMAQYPSPADMPPVTEDTAGKRPIYNSEGQIVGYEPPAASSSQFQKETSPLPAWLIAAAAGAVGGIISTKMFPRQKNPIFPLFPLFPAISWAILGGATGALAIRKLAFGPFEKKAEEQKTGLIGSSITMVELALLVGAGIIAAPFLLQIMQSMRDLSRGRR